MTDNMKTCKTCDESKNKSEFSIGRAVCKPCFAAAHVRRYATDEEFRLKCIAGAAHRAATNPLMIAGSARRNLLRRMRLKEGIMAEGKKLRDFIKNCPKYLTVDHIIPLSKGGLTRLDNLQYITLTANTKKGNRC